MKGVMSCWLPVQQPPDNNDQKNHDQVSLPEGKSRKQASTYLGLVSRAQEYFSYNPEKQKREKSLYLI